MIQEIVNKIKEGSGKGPLLFLFPSSATATSMRRLVGLELGCIHNVRFESSTWLLSNGRVSDRSLPSKLELAIAIRAVLGSPASQSSLDPYLISLENNSSAISQTASVFNELLQCNLTADELAIAESGSKLKLSGLYQQVIELLALGTSDQASFDFDQPSLAQFHRIYACLDLTTLPPPLANLNHLEPLLPTLEPAKASIDGKSLLHDAKLHITPDSFTETMAAVSGAIERIAEGVRPDQIAILFPISHPYSGFVASLLTSAGLKGYGPETRLFMSRAGMRATQLCLEMVGSPAADRLIDSLLMVSVEQGIIPAEAVPLLRDLALTGELDELKPHLKRSRLVVPLPPNGEFHSVGKWLETVIQCVEGLQSARTWTAARAAIAKIMRTFAPPDIDSFLALDSLINLETIQPRPRLADLHFALELLGNSPLGPSSAIQTGIYFGTYQSADGMAFDSVFGLGWQEGQIPMQTADNPLMPDETRLKLGLPSRVKNESTEIAMMQRILGQAPNVEVFYSRTESGQPREAFPSRYFQSEVDIRKQNGSSEPVVTSSTLGAIQTLNPTSESLQKVREQLAFGEGISPRPDPIDFDAVLGQVNLAVDLRPNLTYTTTELENDLLECPLRFYYKSLLKTKIYEPLAPKWQLEPAPLGSLIHKFLFNWGQIHIQAVRHGAPAAWFGFDPTSHEVSLEQAWLTQENQGPKSYFCLGNVLKEVFDIFVLKEQEQGNVILGPAWENQARNIGKALMEYGVNESQSLLKSGTQVEGLEQDIDLNLGQFLIHNIKGRIDRFDRLADGTYQVTDYKSGKVPDPTKEPLLQLPVYAQGVRQIKNDQSLDICGRYLNPVQPDENEFAQTAEQMAFTVPEQRIILGSKLIKKGLFPPHPDESDHGYCNYCDFKMSCPSNRGQIWDTVSASPEWQEFESLFSPMVDGTRKGKTKEDEMDPPPSPGPNPWDDASSQTLLDQEDRSAAVSVDKHTFIEAGAGSGKTTLLIERLSECMLGPLDTIKPSQIVAITFTEKAAGELKSRLRQKLNVQLNLKSGDEAECERIHEAIQHLDEAKISTIHSYCLDICRRSGQVLGLPPLIEPVDDSRWDQLKQQFIAEIRRDSRGADALLWADYFELEISQRNTFALIEELFDHCFLTRLEGVTWDLGIGLDLPIARGKLLEAVQNVRTCAFTGKGNAMSRAIAWLNSQADSGQDDRLIQAAITFPLSRSDLKQFLVQTKSANVDAAQKIEAMLDAVSQYVVMRAKPLLDSLLQRANDWADRLITQGLLSFDAQIICAKKILADPEAAKFEADRVRALFVDEFQDTDPHQAELVMSLVNANSKTTVFLVGDPKQSIYSFRGADLSVYMTVRNRLEEEYRDRTQSLTLNSNFRSKAPIISFINTAFQPLFNPKSTDGGGTIIINSRKLGPGNPGGAGWMPDPEDDQPIDFEASFPFTALQPCRNDSLGGTAPEVRILQPLVAKASVVREHQYTQVADSFLELCGPERMYRFQDAAVLIASRRELPYLTSEFAKRRIPYRLMIDSRLMDSAEGEMLLTVTMAMGDPSDKRAMQGASLSPLFGCKLDDLKHEGSPRFQASHETLAGWRQALAGASMGNWVSFLMNEGRIIETNIESFAIRDKINRWKQLLRIAIDFDRQVGGSFAEFAQYLDSLHSQRRQYKESAILEDDNDAVSIYTVQSAKGLEFPIVACCSLAYSVPSQKSPWLQVHRDRLVWRAGSVQSPKAPDYLKQLEKTNQGELVRLAYVAATRAKDVLIVSLSNSTHGGGISKIMKQNFKNSGVLDGDILRRVDLNHYIPAKSEDGPSLPLRAEPCDSALLPCAQGAKSIATISPTRLKESPSNEDNPPYEPGVAFGSFEDDLPSSTKHNRAEVIVSERGNEALKFGNAFHLLMQKHPFDGPASLNFIESVAKSERVEHRIDDLVAAEKRAWLALEPLLKGGTPLREQFCSIAVGSGLLEGYIDLQIGSEVGIHLVDYKTDRVKSRRELDNHFQTYRLQAGSYAAMLAKAGQQVTNFTFIFVCAENLESPEEYSRTIKREELLELADEARGIAEQVLTGAV